MAEGPIHVALVDIILSMLRAPTNVEHAIFTDCAGEQRDRRSPLVGGYIPDVYAVAVRDSQRRVIGEAKVGKDFESPRTEPQLRAFLSYLGTFERPTLIFAVPFPALAAAASMATRTAKSAPEHIRIIAIAPYASRIIVPGWQG